MELHHTKHHQTYINNAKAALEEQAEYQKNGDHEDLIALQNTIKFNLGGHINHSFFWENLAPQSAGGGGEPEGSLKEYMEDQWDSFDDFKADFIKQATGVQGSGWCWLAYCPKVDQILITTTSNQDPCITTGAIPILGVDVWEHAYYLDYKNVRPDYLKAIFNVLDFNVASERFEKI